MSDTPNNTGNDQKKEDDIGESNRTSESENEKEEKSSVTKSPKKEKEKTAKPVKKTSKKQEKSSEDEARESDEEAEEEEPLEKEKKVGLLDLPLEVSGSRERKKVERLEISYVVATKEKKTDIPEGPGEKLGECPRIEFQIQKYKTDDLKTLHRLLFNRPGTITEIKKNIRKFSGFPFKEDSSEFERKKTFLEKMTTAGLKQICDILDLERGGMKDDLMTRILNFLVEPKSSGKALPSKGRKRSSTKTNRKKSNTDKAKVKANSNKKTKSKSSNQKDDSESENDVEDAEESEKDEESSEEEKLPKKKAPRKETKKAAPKNNKGEKQSSKKSSEEDDSSDDEPLMKKAKQPPTDEELKTLISSILKGANLEEITMKTVCKQVYGNYPDFDLSDRKEFIKTTVRSIIS